MAPLFWLSPCSHLRHTETKVLFLYLHLCLQRHGESLPMTISWLLRGTHSPGKSGEQSLAMFPQTRGPWPDHEVQGLCFQEHLLSQPLSPSPLFLNLNLLENELNLNFNLPALLRLRHQRPVYSHRKCLWDRWTQRFSEVQVVLLGHPKHSKPLRVTASSRL